MTYPPAVLFVQTQPSQLDEPFYSGLGRLLPSKIEVVLLNGGERERRDIDPELGLVPIFPKPSDDYHLCPLPRGWRGNAHLLVRILRLRPRLVVVQDQRWLDKCVIALLCRLAGIPVAMRSDKNHISDRVRSGVPLKLERLLVRVMFDALAPVSPLTANYYGWHHADRLWWFPYPSQEKKFLPSQASSAIRQAVRNRLGIPATQTVFLAVAKFVDRENPLGVLRAFANVRNKGHCTSLIVVGAGPLASVLERYVSDQGLRDVHLVGYVPFEHLHEYFFASDVFVHLARSEPWGVSAQDALVAGMGLITSTQVGAGVCHLTAKLARYVVPVDDDDAAAKAMIELIGAEGSRAHFAPAWKNVRASFTTEALAACWARKLCVSGLEVPRP